MDGMEEVFLADLAAAEGRIPEAERALLAVAERRHLRDRDHPAGAAAQQGHRGPVERRPEQIGRDLAVALAGPAGKSARSSAG